MSFLPQNLPFIGPRYRFYAVVARILVLSWRRNAHIAEVFPSCDQFCTTNNLELFLYVILMAVVATALMATDTDSMGLGVELDDVVIARLEHSWPPGVVVSLSGLVFEGCSFTYI